MYNDDGVDYGGEEQYEVCIHLERTRNNSDEHHIYNEDDDANVCNDNKC